MGNVEDLHSAVRVRFRDQIATPQSLVTIYDNGPDLHPDDEAWSRWTIRLGVAQQLERGNGATYRTPGVAIAQLFDTIENGDQRLLQLADAIIVAFRAVSAGGVRYLVPYSQLVGRAEGRWWQINVICPFQCDENT